MQSNASIEIKNQVKEDLEQRIHDEEMHVENLKHENDYHSEQIDLNTEYISKSTEKIEVLKSLIAELGIE